MIYGDLFIYNINSVNIASCVNIIVYSNMFEFASFIVCVYLIYGVYIAICFVYYHCILYHHLCIYCLCVYIMCMYDYLSLINCTSIIIFVHVSPYVFCLYYLVLLYY